MRLSVIFRRQAIEEFNEAILWYENQQIGLGLDLETEVLNAINLVAAQPDRFPVVYKDVRESSVDRFPYSVLYRVRTNSIVVISVFHQSRNRTVWQSRV